MGKLIITIRPPWDPPLSVVTAPGHFLRSVAVSPRTQTVQRARRDPKSVSREAHACNAHRITPAARAGRIGNVQGEAVLRGREAKGIGAVAASRLVVTCRALLVGSGGHRAEEWFAESDKAVPYVHRLMTNQGLGVGTPLLIIIASVCARRRPVSQPTCSESTSAV